MNSCPSPCTACGEATNGCPPPSACTGCSGSGSSGDEKFGPGGGSDCNFSGDDCASLRSKHSQSPIFNSLRPRTPSDFVLEPLDLRIRVADLRIVSPPAPPPRSGGLPLRRRGRSLPSFGWSRPVHTAQLSGRLRRKGGAIDLPRRRGEAEGTDLKEGNELGFGR